MNASVHHSSREGGIWTDARVARLTELWLDGVSAGLIAKQMDLPKNAVIGKAHRLKLPQRGSPIDRSGKSPEKKARRQAGLARATPPVDKNPPISESVAPVPAQPNPNSAPICQPEELPRRPCLFIAGEKGADFKFYADAPRCPEAARRGSPYCGAHFRLCHVKLATEAAA